MAPGEVPASVRNPAVPSKEAQLIRGLQSPGSALSLLTQEQFPALSTPTALYEVRGGAQSLSFPMCEVGLLARLRVSAAQVGGIISP